MKTAVTAIIASIILFGGIGGFVAYSTLHEESSPYISEVAGAKTTTPTPGGTISLTPEQQAESSSTLKVNQGQQTASNDILDPSQFKAYESYKSSDRMLRQDIKIGTGADIITGKKVAVSYKGWLTDGTVFDESKLNENNELQPFVFTPGTGQVIAGWEQGIIGMKVGGIRRLVIPPVAGYGEQGQGPIPPNSVLIFDIQLLEVEQ